MHLLIGQIVYTNFAGIGCRSLASAQVSREVQQAFIQRVAAKYWDSCNPPKSGYRAAYLHQLTTEHTLFGWLYNDGVDDVGCNYLPYFICYYLAEPLRDFHLENILTCLQKGPLRLIERQNPPIFLETIVVQTPWTFNNDFWSYQPARPGVEIPSGVCASSHIALKQGELLDIFIPIGAQENVIEFKQQTYEQQISNSLILPKQILESSKLSAVTVAITPYQGPNENLQRYQQALLAALQENCVIDDNTRNFLKRLQHFLRLTDEDIKPVEARSQQTRAVQRLEKYIPRIRNKDVISVKVIKEAVVGNEAKSSFPIRILPQILSSLQSFNTVLEKNAHYSFVLAYRNSQLLLGVGIAASALALIGSIYGLLRTNIEPSKPELIPSVSSVSHETLAEVFKVSQVSFKYKESTTVAPP